MVRHKTSLSPSALLVHPFRLLSHPPHPPLHQLCILHLQAFRLLLRNVDLQIQADHLVLHIFAQFLPFPELLFLIA